MRDELRNKYLSSPRLNRYLRATDNDKNRVKRLYNANIRLAQATHPVLTQFEVVLRNSLNLQLSSHFVDNDWIINQKNGFEVLIEIERVEFTLEIYQANS